MKTREIISRSKKDASLAVNTIRQGRPKVLNRIKCLVLYNSNLYRLRRFIRRMSIGRVAEEEERRVATDKIVDEFIESK